MDIHPCNSLCTISIAQPSWKVIIPPLIAVAIVFSVIIRMKLNKTPGWWSSFFRRFVLVSVMSYIPILVVVCMMSLGRIMLSGIYDCDADSITENIKPNSVILTFCWSVIAAFFMMLLEKARSTDNQTIERPVVNSYKVKRAAHRNKVKSAAKAQTKHKRHSSYPDWYEHSAEDHDIEDGWCIECEEHEDDLE